MAICGFFTGLAGIAYWINSHYELEGDKAVGKKDPLVIALKSWVDDQYEEGRQSSITEGELEDKVKEITKLLNEQ